MYRYVYIFPNTHLSENLIFFSSSALLHLSSSTLLSLSQASVSLSQKHQSMNPALLLETNQLLGHGVKQMVELCTYGSSLSRLFLWGLSTQKRRCDQTATWKDLWDCVSPTLCLTLSLCSFRLSTSCLSASSNSWSSLWRALTVLSSWMRSIWFSIPSNIYTNIHTKSIPVASEHVSAYTQGQTSSWTLRPLRNFCMRMTACSFSSSP